MLAELGTLGVLTLLGFVGAVFWACFAAVRRATGPQRAALASITGACVAWAMGRAYVVSTDRRFLESYSELMDEL